MIEEGMDVVQMQGVGIVQCEVGLLIGGDVEPAGRAAVCEPGKGVEDLADA